MTSALLNLNRTLRPAGLLVLAAALVGIGGIPGNSMAGDEQAFDLFPVSKPWLNVRIPRYGEDDVLTSMMFTEILTREDEEHLGLDGLTLVMFDSSGGLSLRLKTKRGIYDTGTNLLRTHTTTFIEHPQFDMKGDRMRFDTSAQEGLLEGNVEMLIYNIPVSVPGNPVRNDSPKPNPNPNPERKGKPDRDSNRAMELAQNDLEALTSSNP